LPTTIWTLSTLLDVSRRQRVIASSPDLSRYAIYRRDAGTRLHSPRDHALVVNSCLAVHFLLPARLAIPGSRLWIWRHSGRMTSVPTTGMYGHLWDTVDERAGSQHLGGTADNGRTLNNGRPFWFLSWRTGVTISWAYAAGMCGFLFRGVSPPTYLHSPAACLLTAVYLYARLPCC